MSFPLRNFYCKWIIRSFLFVFLSFLAGFLFQNCGKAGFEAGVTNLDSIADSSGGGNQSPLAFDTSMDQITYNSCAHGELRNDPAYFSVMAGAYDQAGITLTTEFLNYAKANLKPIYPATTISDLQIKQFLVESAENKGAVPQLAFRLKNQVKELRYLEGSSPTLGLEFVNIFSNLQLDQYMTTVFANKGSRINFFPLGNNGQRRLEGRLGIFNSSEAAAKLIRDALNNDTMLGLVYSGSNTDPRIIKGTSANAAVAKGRGYHLSFASAKAPRTTSYNLYPDNPNNILIAVGEFDLSNPTNLVSSWSCEEARRYVIMRKSDSASCPSDSYGRLADSNYRRELEIVRRHLKSEYWDVSIDGHCVVPKAVTKECYPQENFGIQYDQSKACYYEGRTLAGAVPTERCAHFISICLRPN